MNKLLHVSKPTSDSSEPLPIHLAGNISVPESRPPLSTSVPKPVICSSRVVCYLLSGRDGFNPPSTSLSRPSDSTRSFNGRMDASLACHVKLRSSLVGAKRASFGLRFCKA